jgi:hypothetical protein
MKPNEYIKWMLQHSNQLGDLRNIAESQMKFLDERRVNRKEMQFVTDDLPSFERLISSSKENLTPRKIKELEKRFGENEKILRKEYDFWSKVLNQVKRMGS